MSEIGDLQRTYLPKLAKLIQWAYENGYELTMGDAYRDPRVHGDMGVKKEYGSANSCHKLRLAMDLNLFKNDKYLTSDEDHAPLHDFWESIGGSKRIIGDANHYSLEWQGYR